MTTKEHNEQLREKWEDSNITFSMYVRESADWWLSHTIPVESVKEVIGKIEKMKCTGTMKDLPEMREYNHGLDKALSLLSTLVDTK